MFDSLRQRYHFAPGIGILYELLILAEMLPFNVDPDTPATVDIPSLLISLGIANEMCSIDLKNYHLL